MDSKESGFEWLDRLFSGEEDAACDEFMDRLLEKMAKVFDKRVAGVYDNAGLFITIVPDVEKFAGQEVVKVSKSSNMHPEVLKELLSLHLKGMTPRVMPLDTKAAATVASITVEQMGDVFDDRMANVPNSGCFIMAFAGMGDKGSTVDARVIWMSNIVKSERIKLLKGAIASIEGDEE